MRRSRASQPRCPRLVGAWLSSSSRKGSGTTRSRPSPGSASWASSATCRSSSPSSRGGPRPPRRAPTRGGAGLRPAPLTPRGAGGARGGGSGPPRRYGHGLTLVFFDVDDFKLVNDTYGHPEGDRVLRVVAHLIRERLRRS